VTASKDVDDWEEVPTDFKDPITKEANLVANKGYTNSTQSLVTCGGGNKQSVAPNLLQALVVALASTQQKEVIPLDAIVHPVSSALVEGGMRQHPFNTRVR